MIEWFWKRLHRRATHNRLLDCLGDLTRSLRSSLCHYRTTRGRVRSLIPGCYTLSEGRTASPSV